MAMRHDLLTETPNPASAGIDALSTTEMLQVINAADQEIATAVGREIPNIAVAVDAIVERLNGGGRLFYIGAGTSGRLGVLDASECPPTFNTPPDLVQALIAGGDTALRYSIEKAEDDPEQAKRDLRERSFQNADALVGIAASGDEGKLKSQPSTRWATRRCLWVFSWASMAAPSAFSH